MSEGAGRMPASMTATVTSRPVCRFSPAIFTDFRGAQGGSSGDTIGLRTAFFFHMARTSRMEVILIPRHRHRVLQWTGKLVEVDVGDAVPLRQLADGSRFGQAGKAVDDPKPADCLGLPSSPPSHRPFSRSFPKTRQPLPISKQRTLLADFGNRGSPEHRRQSFSYSPACSIN